MQAYFLLEADMIIIILCFILMFWLGIMYGMLMERKKQSGINIKRPIEWFRG